MMMIPYISVVMILLSTMLSESDSMKIPKQREISHNRQVSYCEPMIENFNTTTLPNGWTSLSTNVNSYSMNPSGGINLVLNPPASRLVTPSKDGKTNDKLGDGSTINSTYSLLYGKVSITVSSSSVPGTVTGLVLLGTKSLDEIDVEILGGDVKHWQTNVFKPAEGEREPLYGIFGGVHGFPNDGTVQDEHRYEIDWSPSRIIWSVDGNAVRSLIPQQTIHGEQQHYPSAISRIQLGIWDASSPVGTSEWAHGPIPWSNLNEIISSTIKSVEIQCPY